MRLLWSDRKEPRAIDEFIDFEKKMHRRLRFVEAQAKRIGRPGPWRRHMTIIEGDFEPIGRWAQALFALETVAPRHWWLVAGAGLLLIVLIGVAC